MHPLIEQARRAAQLGQWAEAERLARGALAEVAADIDAIEILVLARRQSGDVEAAEQLLCQAIAAAPGRRWPYGDLARLLIESGRPVEAEAVARQALCADATNADALALLGNLELDRGLLIEAEGHLRQAIGIAGPHPELVLALGRSLILQGRSAAARQLLEPLARGPVPSLELTATLAELEERCGNFAVARQWLDRAEALGKPRGIDVTLQRAKLLARMGQSGPALQLLEGQQQLSGAALLQRGRLRDQMGRHTEAWRDWHEGKARIAEQAGRRYPADELIREATALRQFASRITTSSGEAETGSAPIFILGLPRSGTTLIEQVITAHSAVSAGGELPFGPELRDLAAHGCSGEEAFLAWLTHGSGPSLGVISQSLRDHYLARAATYRLQGRFTDKMPLNELWLPLIRLAFPEARVIRMQRHPLDVLVSVMSHDMTHGHNFAYRLEDAVAHMLLIHRQLEHYAACGLRIDHVVRYEVLVAHQQSETTRLMAALGLEAEEQQLHFHQSERIAPTPSYAQVREPLNARSIGRWRNFAAELGSAREALMPMIEALGYTA